MLDEKLLRSRLVEPGLVSRLQRVESVASTNAELIAAADSAEFAAAWPHMSVLTAEEQTAGRGRLGRGWASPKGTALATSVLLRPEFPRHQWHWLTLTAGLALVNALCSRELPASLKWPNDVHIHGRKIAGLLAAVPPGDPSSVIVGCGINVLADHDQLPTPTATSLVLELQHTRTPPPKLATAAAARLRTDLLADWLEHFCALTGQVQQHRSIDPLRSQIIAAISTVGQQVRIELPDGTAARGAAVAVEHDGALAVEVTARRRTEHAGEAAGAAGSSDERWYLVPAQRQRFSAGEVVHLRPAEQ